MSVTWIFKADTPEKFLGQLQVELQDRLKVAKRNAEHMTLARQRQFEAGSAYAYESLLIMISQMVIEPEEHEDKE